MLQYSECVILLIANNALLLYSSHHPDSVKLVTTLTHWILNLAEKHYAISIADNTVEVLDSVHVMRDRLANLCHKL